MNWQKHLRGWLVTVALVAFLGTLIYVILPFRAVAPKITEMAQNWATAAPKAGEVDSAIQGFNGVTAAATLAIPTHSEVMQPIDAATQGARDADSLIRRTDDHLNRPCGGGYPCGTLAEANKVLVKTGDAIVTTQLQERAITPHTIAAMDSITALMRNANGQVTEDGPYAKNILASVSGITQDSYQAYNAWLHPPKCRHFGCRFQRYVLGNLPIAYHAIQAADAAHDLFSGQKIYGSIKVTK